MNARDGIVLGVYSYKDNAYLANLAKPSGSLDPFAPSIKIYIHQDNIGLILHRL